MRRKRWAGFAAVTAIVLDRDVFIIVGSPRQRPTMPAGAPIIFPTLT